MRPRGVSNPNMRFVYALICLSRYTQRQRHKISLPPNDSLSERKNMKTNTMSSYAVSPLLLTVRMRSVEKRQSTSTCGHRRHPSSHNSPVLHTTSTSTLRATIASRALRRNDRPRQWLRPSYTSRASDLPSWQMTVHKFFVHVLAVFMDDLGGLSRRLLGCNVKWFFFIVNVGIQTVGHCQIQWSGCLGNLRPPQTPDNRGQHHAKLTQTARPQLRANRHPGRRRPYQCRRNHDLLQSFILALVRSPCASTSAL